MKRLTLVALLALAGCDKPNPATVYVGSEAYRSGLAVRICDNGIPIFVVPATGRLFLIRGMHDNGEYLAPGVTPAQVCQ